MKDLPKRKNIRLDEFDYSKNGYYYITICTKNREKILGEIVGDGVLDVPKMKLSYFGVIAENVINNINNFYDDIVFDKYVIMPNHIHLIIKIQNQDGLSRTPTPTNSTISKIVSTFKRFCNREYKINIWQRSFYEHIIRNEDDYLKISEYIINNPLNWKKDSEYI